MGSTYHNKISVLRSVNVESRQTNRITQRQLAGCQSLGMCLVWEHAGLGWSNYRFKGWDDPVLCLAVGMGSSLVPCLFGNNGRWDKTSAMWASHGGLYSFFFLSSLPRPHTPLLQMRLACTSTRPGPCTGSGAAHSAFFIFILKKIKFQKYMSNREIFKNGCVSPP